MKYNGAVLLLLWIWTALYCTAWHEELCVSTSCLSCPVPFSFWWGGVGVFLKERRAWWVGREKVEGGHWNPTTQTSLNGSDRPGPGEEMWKLTSTSTHNLCARLDIHLSRTWYLFKPQWVSIDTREWSKGEYALCHQTVGLYLMVTFHIDQEQISSALRSWQSAFFLFKVFFSLLACLLCFSWCTSLCSLYLLKWSGFEYLVLANEAPLAVRRLGKLTEANCFFRISLRILALCADMVYFWKIVLS